MGNGCGRRSRLSTSIHKVGCHGCDLGQSSEWWAWRDLNPQPDRYERPALTIELQAPPPDAMTIHGGWLYCYHPNLQAIRQGAKASRAGSASLRLQRSGKVPDHTVLDGEPIEFLFVLRIEGGVGGCRSLSPPRRGRLDLAIAVVQGVEQAGEGRIRDLDLRHGRSTSQGDGAKLVAGIAGDLGTEPGRRLELAGRVVAF